MKKSALFLNFMLPGLLLSFSLSLFSCAPVNQHSSKNIISTEQLESDAVINGTLVTVRNTPAARSVVKLEMRQSSGIIMASCTGTLIGKNTVLTAGHCIDKKLFPGLASIDVVFANGSTTDKNLIRTAKKFSAHPKYNSIPFETYEWVWNPQTQKWEKKPVFLPGKNYDHDIAIIVFPGTIPTGFAPVSIDTDSKFNYAGYDVYIYGYGRTVDYPALQTVNTSGRLHRGVMRVGKDFDLDSDRYWSVAISNQFTCQGDSGGPQFFQENGILKVIGVISCSSGDFAENQKRSCKGPGKNIRVAPAAHWIRTEEQRLLKN